MQSLRAASLEHKPDFSRTRAYLLLFNKKLQAFNYLSKAHKVQPKNAKVWELLIGLDEYKNDPLISEVKKLARNKSKITQPPPLPKKTSHTTERVRNMNLKHLLLLSMTAVSFSCFSDDAESSKKLAQEVPIADVHRHVQRWVSPELLRQQMEKNNVRWSGAVGAPFGPFDTTPYAKLLQNKYIPTTGQVELGDIFGQHGAAGLTDINLRTYQELLANADNLFSTGQIKGFGELILNNKQTNPNVSFRRKVKIDSAPIDAMFAIANKHKGFVQIHSEDDADSVEELKSLSVKYANTSLILSHCLFTSNVDLIRSLLGNSSNIFCEMSARSRSHFPNPDSERAKSLIVYSEDSVKPEWVALIEEFPTRFMVGTDTYNPRVNFEKNIEEIRGGLLSKLKVSTIELVAYKNAVRVMRLE